MEQENQAALLPFLRRVKERFPNKGIWLYSGFTWEQLTQGPSRAYGQTVPQILALLDVRPPSGQNASGPLGDSRRPVSCLEALATR